jgi:hypothetical protein
MVETEDGVEVERVEAVVCRRCDHVAPGRARVHLTIRATTDYPTYPVRRLHS